MVVGLPAPVPLAFERDIDPNAPAVEPATSRTAGLDGAAWGLDRVVEGASSDFERVRRMAKWVHDRFKHDGGRNEPTWAPGRVLEGASKGESFACTEYAKVLYGALSAVGIPARILSLRTSDVETRESSAGHVLTEAYLRDERRWAIVDAQFDAAPTVGGKPVNAVELQAALVEREPSLKVLTSSAGEYWLRGVDATWLDFVQSYLHYFKTPTLAAPWDAEQKAAQRKANRPTHIMLVPAGERAPTRFQRGPDDDLPHTYVTHSAATFYLTPKGP